MEKKITSIDSIKSEIKSVQEYVAVLSETVALVPDFIEQRVSKELSSIKEIKGKDGIDGIDGIDGLNGKDGTNGKDGSPDNPLDIKSKLESLTGDNRLDAFSIKNLPSLVEKVSKDGYPYGLPQPAGAITYQLNGSQVGRGNVLNLIGDNITTTANGDSVTYDLSTSEGIESVLVDNQTVFGDGVNVPLFAQSNSNNKIISGGASWSGTGYVFDVSALTYWFDGVLLGPTTPTQITLDSADPTSDRFDAIVVDQAGIISNITGTASANPVFPAIPDTQLLVQYVNIGAGSTSPSILQNNIYIDNTEWATSTYTTGTGSTGTVDFNSTNSPKEGSKCIDLLTNQRLGAKFTRATATDVQQFAFIQVWYRNNTALATNKTPTVRFDNSAGNPVGNTVSLVAYGVDRTIVGTWQLAVIPISAFGAITLIKGLRAIVTGGTLASQANWSLDFMLLSGGILPPGAIGPIYLSPSNTLYSTGAATGATSVTDSIFFGNLSGFQATDSNNSIFQGAGAGYKSVNSGSTVFIGNDSGRNSPNTGFGTFLGVESGMNLNASDNDRMSGIGYRALKGSTGSYNMAWGHEAGINTTGDLNTMIGASSSAGGFSGSIVLGNGATATKNTQFFLPVSITSFSMAGMQSFANDAAAGTGGLSTGELYYNTTVTAVSMKQ